MTLARWASLARKALHRPARHVLVRAVQELRRQALRPWSRIRPRLLTDRALLALNHAPSIDELWERQAGRPFFVGPARHDAWAARFSEAFPAARVEILDAATAVLRHEFDLLGSGVRRLGDPIPWHDDFKAGHRWPLRYCHDIEYNDLDQPSDVKVPWELSRCQHFTTLGQAYWLSGDERFAREFVAEVTDWHRQNPWAYGVNWACTMDVALRAISWIWGFYYFAQARACDRAAFRGLFLRSLWLHGEFIAANLEIGDVNGNHYLTDGVGLVFLGLFFKHTKKGAKWLEEGKHIVFQEIFTQVHADGVDFEQSTAYHRLVLEAFLTSYLLLRLHGEAIPEDAWGRLERMHEFVCAYTKPDGLAPLIGDADDGRIQKLGGQGINDHRYLLSTGAALFDRVDFKRASERFWEESFWLLGPEGMDRYDRIPRLSGPLPSMAFHAGGFCIMRGEASHLIIDCAEVGMHGRGGHGHNDILSFELFLNGMNVVTDCGAYLYTASREWRNRFRSTAFHNVVQVDDEELNRFVHPNELWRLHNDAVPTDVCWEPGPDVDYFRGGHRGYARLDAPVAHSREVVFDRRSPRVVVRDHLDGSGVHRLVWRFHFDPGIRVELRDLDVRLSLADREVWLFLLESLPGAVVRLETGWVSPSYGVRVDTHVFVLEAAPRLPLSLTYLFADRHLPPASRAALVSGLMKRSDRPGQAGSRGPFPPRAAERRCYREPTTVHPGFHCPRGWL